ncbi:MAG: helix-turn-helix domain-containing protein [Bacilli bacterium]|nr:helix-turn-helix domain-containing protein [Bacilli bacterium]
MQELGEYLKETRVNNGVSIDEAAQDLNIDSFLLESVEDGNTRAFKDVLSMKKIVKEYAKYLGLKPEEVIDEFNDFLFEKTSKISLQDILDAEKKTTDDNNSKKIASPYTIVKPKKKDRRGLFIGLIVVLIVIILVLLIFNLVKPKKEIITSELKSKIEGDYLYELTK